MKKTDKAEQKAKIRSVYLKKRNAIAAEKRVLAGGTIRERFYRMKRLKTAETVFLYASYKSEVPTKELIQGLLLKGKKVAMPKVDGDRMDFYEIDAWEELLPGYQGILEPESRGKTPVIPKDSDIMLLPGTVFDRKGGRIGYGGGYYDRYLERIAENYGVHPLLVGICYQAQVYPGRLPMEETDRRVEYVITEKRAIKMEEKASGKFGGVIEGVFELVLDVLLEIITDN